MLQPLISLWRHNAKVTFFDAAGAQETIEPDFSGLAFGSPIGMRRMFSHVHEAMAYLRFWMGEPGALSELRWVLQKTGPSVSGSRGGAEQWLQSLATRLQSGAVVVIEETVRRQFLGRMVAPPSAGGFSSLASLADLASLPSLPLLSMVLPDLSSLQVEGAQVLPEINDSIRQVSAATATVGNFSISLSPAPSKVADITSSMRTRAARVDSALSAM